MSTVRYKGADRTRKEIAEMEGVCYDTLVRVLRRTKDIDYAVQYCKQVAGRTVSKKPKDELSHRANKHKIKDVPEGVRTVFYKIMMTHSPSAFNLRAGRSRQEYLFDGDLIAYQIMLNDDIAFVTARLKSNGNVLMQRRIHVV